MNEKHISVTKIINTLNQLSQLTEDQIAVFREAFVVDGYDFVFCRNVAKKLNEFVKEDFPEVLWNAKKVSDFLNAIEVLQNNLYSLNTEELSFSENLREFFQYMNYPEKDIETLTSDELEKAGHLLFNNFVLNDPEINLINGIIGTSLSLSLKTVFAADGSLRVLIPIATLRITSQSGDEEILNSFFQLALPDIEELLSKLQEVRERILTLGNRSEDKNNA